MNQTTTKHPTPIAVANRRRWSEQPSPEIDAQARDLLHALGLPVRDTGARRWIGALLRNLVLTKLESRAPIAHGLSVCRHILRRFPFAVAELAGGKERTTR